MTSSPRLAAAPRVDLGATGSGRAARSTPLARFADEHRVLLPVTALVVMATVFAPSGMSPVARLTLAVFTVMLSLTAFTRANEVVVCAASLGALVLVGGSSVGDAVAAVTSHTMVLLVGAFVVAAAAKQSGIAERMAFAIGGRAGTVGQLTTRITWVLIATAFLVPSTSGRAALMLPVYLAFAERIPHHRVRRALAVLFPAVILLSAVASLFGAGAHVVMTELVAGVGADRIDFLQWTLYGLPFAIVSSFASLAVVRWMFLRRHERALPVDLARAATPWSRDERVVTVVLVALTMCWLTESLHGVPAWLAAVIGAGIVTVGPFRTTGLGEARAALPLDLLFVMAITAEAGSALARTGAADWIAVNLLGSLVERGGSTVLVVVVVGVVSLLAHLVVTSRTARASVLIPVVILVGAAADIDVTALAYLSTAAAGYCLTTTTSAKPIRVFSTVQDGYDETDLRRLSLRLLPLHALLLVGFAFYVWPMLGLALGPAERRDLDGLDNTGDPAAELPWAGVRIDGLDVGPRWADSPTSAPPLGPGSDDGDGQRPTPLSVTKATPPEPVTATSVTEPRLPTNDTDPAADTTTIEASPPEPVPPADDLVLVPDTSTDDTSSEEHSESGDDGTAVPPPSLAHMPPPDPGDGLHDADGADGDGGDDEDGD